jgi:protocatechuate 3,4-dioxygenase beta subunit
MQAVEMSGAERSSPRARRRGKAAATLSGETAEAAAGETATADGATKEPVVVGWVRDHRGKPLEGATVGVIPPGGDSPARTTTTDAEGYYEFDDVSPEEQKLMAYAHQLDDFVATGATALTALDQAKLAEEQAIVEIRTQELVAREKLKLTEVYSSWVAQVRSPPAANPSTCPEPNATGLCTSCHPDKVDLAETLALVEYKRAVASQELLSKGFLAMGENVVIGENIAFTGAGPARYTVVAQLDGYRVETSEPFELKDGESVQVELSLEGTMAITGSVVGADGSPIPDADVAVVGHAGDRLLPGNATKTRTDADGAFTLASLPAGVYAIRASAAGFEPIEAIAFTGGHAPFVLPSTGSARVTVARSETDEALSGFRVDLRKGRWVVAQGVTGDDGVALIADVPPGDYMANTYREGSTSRQSRARGQIVVQARRESTIRLEVAEKVKVGGHVDLRDPAASPVGLSVKATRLDDSGEVDASPKTVEIAEDGSFQWSSGLAPGDYVIELHSGSKGTGAVIGSMDLGVTAGQEIEDLLVAEGAKRREATPREAAREAPATAPSFEPLSVDDRTVTVQESMKLRTFLALLGASGAAAIAPSPEVEASGILDHAWVKTTGTSGFQSLLRGSIEPHGLH